MSRSVVQKVSFVASFVLVSSRLWDNYVKVITAPDGVVLFCQLMLMVHCRVVFDHRISVENAYLEEKEDACCALGELAQHTR